ncbi:MAG TPA: SprT family zinc-dependent metalloprotease [Ramlibacter sp.]|uniref:M48 family metallopeptidase n=1 Tax=Ramlibacter sp. TaxID=1917967 RepID=UPI002B7FBB20|nr:SprT family zinc-dependent metalloprotease [Ramlibacter sp.]HVZ44087.1 SprT family zinc-dependent metalloprotease [Ramlibacter sp.]
MPSPFQLLLDLFDEPKPIAAPSAPAPPAQVHDPRPALALDRAIAPHTFRHPQANRQALLGHVVIEYQFKRAKRRSIGFSIAPEGLTVTAPRWVPLAEIDEAVRKKAAWITARLGDARERAERIEAARIQWKEGASFPFLGEDVIVVLDPRHGFHEAGAMLNTEADALPGVPRHALHVGLPQSAEPKQIRDAVQAWLMRQARRVFAERLDHFAPRLGVRWKRLSLSSAGTLWGTAKQDGSIRLNWRLVHFRMPVIDYVVAHELSHLREMNHSPRFWDTVRSVMPDYEELRGQLKDEALPPW